jgi:single-stranded-DNA-specific exonuclease
LDQNPPQSQRASDIAPAPEDLPSALLGVAQSITGRFWRQRSHDDRTALALAQRLGLPDIIGRVLAGRGVTPETCDHFLNPTLKDHLPDPSRFQDMDRAADRLTRAIMSGEKVAVFGDYDVDGATSSALLKRFFEAVGADLTIYIPDRMAEGYGPNAPALLKLRGDGASVVVTVDCGTTAHAPLAEGQAAGLEIIVVDHHQAEPVLPKVFAVVNPNRLDETGECGQLAAIGVTYLLVIALNRQLRDKGWYRAPRREPNLLQWLDLVALGTVCDVVPLTGLNRALVTQGLKVMAQRRNIGLTALADTAGVEDKPGTYHAGYILGPRVNAGGRVGRSELGAQLLSTSNADQAREIAASLDRYNQERRAIEAMVEEQAVAAMEARLEAGTLGPVVMAVGQGWHPGVIGIVASRLRERYRRPAFVIAVSDGIGKGSGRSVPGVDLGAAVTAAKQAGILVNGGGHKMAAGVTVDESRLAELEGFFTTRLGTVIEDASGENTIGFDGALAVKGATRELVDTLEQAGPYGSGNAEPRFAVARAKIVNSSVVGDGHVRCILAGQDGGRLKAIAFRSADNDLGQCLLKSGGRLIHVAGHLRADNWRGDRNVQLMIEDAAWA